MTMFTPVSAPLIEQADRIRQNAETAYGQIRSNGDLTVDAIRARLAAVYLDAKTRMDSLHAEATDGYQASWQKALIAAFGTSDLASTAADRAALSLSYRDAQDRAAALDSDRAAADLLSRANDTGDELLARAVAQRAWEMGGQLGGVGWGDVLDTFTSTRPRAAAAIATLVNLQGSGRNASSLFAWMIATPSELAGMSDYQISALAAS